MMNNTFICERIPYQLTIKEFITLFKKNGFVLDEEFIQFLPDGKARIYISHEASYNRATAIFVNNNGLKCGDKVIRVFREKRVC
jgi:hypothetical protein